MEALVLIRGPLLPEVPIRPGTFLHGRVVDSRTLMLEGVRLAARLPGGVEAGDVLRLRVEESGTERLHLRVVERPAAEASQPAPAPVPVGVPLPGGASIAVLPDGGTEGARGRGGRQVVTVRFDSPALGRLDIRLDAQSAAVHVSAGEPVRIVRGGAPELSAALAGVTGHPVQVTVHPRARTLDASA